MSWESFRDWEISEAVSDLEKDSYDLVGRDLPIHGSQENFHFLRYRSDKNFVEARFYYPSSTLDHFSLAEGISHAKKLLAEEAFTYRISISSIDSMSPDYLPEVYGNYRLDDSTDMESIEAELSGVLDYSLMELSELRINK